MTAVEDAGDRILAGEPLGFGAGPFEVAVCLLDALERRCQFVGAFGGELERGVSPARQRPEHQGDGEGQRAADQQDQPGQEHLGRRQGTPGHAHVPGATRGGNGRLDGVVEAGPDRRQRRHLIAQLKRSRIGGRRERLGDQLLGIDQPDDRALRLEGGDLAAVLVRGNGHGHVEALVAVRQLDRLRDGDLLVQRGKLEGAERDRLAQRVGERRVARVRRRHQDRVRPDVMRGYQLAAGRVANPLDADDRDLVAASDVRPA